MWDDAVMLKTKVLGLMRLFRFELPFTAGVCVLLGQLLALKVFPTISEMLLGFLSVFLISAAALILNDYFDLETDKINSPERPLPSGMVTKQEVVILFCSVTILGWIAAYLINLQTFWVALFVWVVGFLYNWRLKKAGLLGNLMVSFSVAMTFIFGGVAVGQPFEKVVWLFAILAFLINFGEEIAADAMDVEGDQRTGSRSLPTLIGRERTLKVSASVFFLVCLFSILPFLFGWLQWIYSLPFLIMDAVILYSTAKLLDANSQHRRAYIRWIYLSAMVAMLAVITIQLYSSYYSG